MSNFATASIKKQRAYEERQKRMEKLADFFYGLAKLSFGGLVIGEAIYWHNGDLSYSLLVMGACLTSFFALTANDILK